ncbi:MAG: hypothetical protein M1837_000796 [Sclerophora amabilis]|nr:MAG: hypothetical protein M1837_000796 [Sclerophora amabilis]
MASFQLYQEPPKYRGTTKADLQEYLEQCETVFETSELFPNDQTRICYAKQYIHGNSREDWARSLRNLREPTWEDYKKSLTDSLGKPLDRLADAYQAYL